MSETLEIVVITGPTGIGKSAVAIEAAKALNGEIVNADSVQVYQDFDIGSWKPNAQDFARVPHHLFSVIHPEHQFDAAQFATLARAEVEKIVERGALPIVAGGTGMYVRTLLHGLAPVESISETALQVIEEKGAEFDRLGLSQVERSSRLHEWLDTIDHEAASKLHPHDLFRTKRAILVKLSTGKSIAEVQQEHRYQTKSYRVLVVCLWKDRAQLYAGIDARVEQMLDVGLVDEVKRLRQLYPLNSPPFGAIGYRHVGLFLDGQLSYLEMANLIKRDTRRFAKRQMTWWRNQPAALGWREIFDSSLECSLEQNVSDAVIAVIDCYRQRKTVFDADDIMFWSAQVK